MKFLTSQNSYFLKEKEDLQVNLLISCPYDYPIVNDDLYQLSYHIYDEEGNVILWEGEKYSINSFMNQIIAPITIQKKLFPKNGIYYVEFDIIGKDLVWCSEKGGRTLKLKVVLSSTQSSIWSDEI